MIQTIAISKSSILTLFVLVLQSCNTYHDEKIESRLKFAYQIDSTYYPDVSIYFDFKEQPDDSLMYRINDYKEQFKEKYAAYIDDLSPDTVNGYFLYCDFQATPYRPGMFDEFARGVNAIEGIEKLKRMKVE